MISAEATGRISWMVRLLAAVGLTTIVVLVGLVDYQMRSTRFERGRLRAEQERLYQISEEILRRSSDARGEIIAILAEGAPVNASYATEELATMIDRLHGSAQPNYISEEFFESSLASTRKFTSNRRLMIPLRTGIRTRQRAPATPGSHAAAPRRRGDTE